MTLAHLSNLESRCLGFLYRTFFDTNSVVLRIYHCMVYLGGFRKHTDIILHILRMLQKQRALNALHVAYLPVFFLQPPHFGASRKIGLQRRQCVSKLERAVNRRHEEHIRQRFHHHNGVIGHRIKCREDFLEVFKLVLT